jgi:hypothetical protein
LELVGGGASEVSRGEQLTATMPPLNVTQIAYCAVRKSPLGAGRTLLSQNGQ